MLLSMQFLTYLTLAGCLCQAYDSVIHTIVWSNICPKVWEDSTMSHAKQASKRKRRSKALPVLGAAGLSLSLASGASAVTGGPAADMPTRNTGESHEITLGEEEISDVSLATFYVFDKENAGTSRPSVQLARGGCGGCGCGGCTRLRRLQQRLRRLRRLRRLAAWCGGCGGCGGGWLLVLEERRTGLVATWPAPWLGLTRPYVLFCSAAHVGASRETLACELNGVLFAIRRIRPPRWRPALVARRVEVRVPTL